MSAITNHLNELVQDLRKYFESRIEYAKLDVTEKTVRIISFFITVFLLTLIIFPFFLFLSFALAYFVGQLLNSTALGFLIVAGGFLILGSLVIALRNPLIKKPVLKAMVKMIFEQSGPNVKFEDEDDDEDEK